MYTCPPAWHPPEHAGYPLEIHEAMPRKLTSMRYKGICQCGKVAFELDDELAGAAAFHCAACTRKDTPLWGIPRDRLRLLASEEGIGAYTFNGHIVGHRFCRTCGVHLYGEDLDGTGRGMAYVNVDCIAEAAGLASLGE